MRRQTRKVILVTSMLGMSVCYLVLGGCFYIIEDNLRGGSSDSSLLLTGPFEYMNLEVNDGTNRRAVSGCLEVKWS